MSDSAEYDRGDGHGSRVIQAFRSLIETPDPVEEMFEPDVFHADIRVEYPVVDESVEEAEAWIRDVLEEVEHDGEHITITLENVERDSDV